MRALIGTHSGTFHADEALGVWLLKRLPRFSTHQVVRSRDERVLSECQVLVDVGSVYDPAALRFDHHQREFAGTFPGRSVRLSSAGLVYLHFGREVLCELVNPQLSPSALELVYGHLYEEFVEGMDGIDNGVSQYWCPEHPDAVIVPRYKNKTDLGARVQRLNSLPAEQNPFECAMTLVGQEFSFFLHEAVTVWLPAREEVEQSFAQRPHPEILVLRKFAPWQDHLYDLERVHNHARVLFVLFPDGDTWRVRAVPRAPDSFESRLPLPEPWRGLRGEQLDALMPGNPGAVFVHATGFIGGHKTLDGALGMAKSAIETKR